MKRLMFSILLISFCLTLSGCGPEFAAGFGSGAAAMQQLADDAQNDFIIAVNALNEETNKINSAVVDIDDAVFIKPEVMESIQSLKGREKDPVTWVALASLLANTFWGGKSFAGRKNRDDEVS